MCQLSNRAWLARSAILLCVALCAACASPGNSQDTKPAAAVKPAESAKAAEAKPAVVPEAVPAAKVGAAKPAVAKPRRVTAPAPRPPVRVAAVPAGGANVFNRLLRRPGQRHLPPWQDAIHNPDDPVIHLLQAPMVAFASLPKTRDGAGNGVDWDKALDQGKIKPRWELTNPKARPAVLDLNIIRQVKGSMPDVVYPHKPHTKWLDCSNCHPAIFIPKKGANQISMAAILMGQKCGVCHGKVAFPVSECLRCHSKSKTRKVKAKAKARP